MQILTPMKNGSDEGVKEDSLGIEGKYHWPIRIMSVLLFTATLAVNYVIGQNTGSISDIYHLWVTPPGLFFLVWAVIYTTLAIVVVYNFFKNEWTARTHIAFGISNILNLMWILVFNNATPAAIYVDAVIIALIIPSLLITWIEMGKDYLKGVKADEVPWKAYIVRNVFAFYLGWIIAATNLNLGMVFVYWWGATKYTQFIIFWVMAPACALGAFIFNGIREGKRGLLSCFCLWFTVAWAFSGAGITSNGCRNGTLSLC